MIAEEDRINYLVYHRVCLHETEQTRNNKKIKNTKNGNIQTWYLKFKREGVAKFTNNSLDQILIVKLDKRPVSLNKKQKIYIKNTFEQ